jgi:hypothetical protein
MLQVLNIFVAACAGVLLLSLFGRTGLVTLVPDPVAGKTYRRYHQEHRGTVGSAGTHRRGASCFAIQPSYARNQEFPCRMRSAGESS